MQRKPGFPTTTCNIKMPDNVPVPDGPLTEDEGEHLQKRQQLINFGHSQWGFNNWNWSVTKQELDFVDFANGKYTAGVVGFVSISVKNLDIHRENIGYATAQGSNKGFAIYKARKCAVTNALRETLLSFGGNVATELMDLLDTQKIESANSGPVPEPIVENNQIPIVKPEPQNSPLNRCTRKDSADSTHSLGNPANNVRLQHPAVPAAPPAIKNAAGNPPPVAKAHPMPANLPPAANRAPLAANAPRPPPPPAPAAPVRPNSNDPPKPLEQMTEEEARAERRRRQRLAQEEFRQKQLMKQTNDEKPELRGSSSFDSLIMAVQTQDIVIEDSGWCQEGGKRKSPGPENLAKRKQTSISKLDMMKP